MFSSHGPDRSPRQNRVLAAYLALNGGFVNSAGFVVLGVFTSHVSGNVGKLSDDAARGSSASAIAAAMLVLAFGLGGFWASSILQSPVFQSMPLAYAFALLNESALLTAFVRLSPWGRGFELASGVLLGLAMGMQNSLVTQISHARVRTTHLTGVTTDLSIELATWWRWSRHEAGGPHRPSPTTALLLLTILATFIAGAFLGAWAAVKWGREAMLAPAGAVLLASIYAFDSKRRNRQR